MGKSLVSCFFETVYIYVTVTVTVSCFSKIQIGFAFLVPAHLSSPGKRAIKRVWNICIFDAEYTHVKYPVVKDRHIKIMPRIYWYCQHSMHSMISVMVKCTSSIHLSFL